MPKTNNAAENATKSDALATTNHATALAEAGIDLAADAAELGAEFGTGDLQVPFLLLLQSGSPQVKKGDPKAIKGAEEGDLLAVATKKVYKLSEEPLIVVPVHFRKTFVEWILKDEGGGFIADHGPVAGAALLAKCVKDEKSRFIVPNTNSRHQLVETMQYALLYIDKEDGAQQGILSLTSTQLKKGRSWNTAMESVRIDHPTTPGAKLKPPVFYMSYAMGSVSESKDNYRWMGYEIVPHGPVFNLENGPAIYKMARELKQMVNEGAFNLETAAQADPESNTAAKSDSSSDGNGNNDSYMDASQGNDGGGAF